MHGFVCMYECGGGVHGFVCMYECEGRVHGSVCMYECEGGVGCMGLCVCMSTPEADVSVLLHGFVCVHE